MRQVTSGKTHWHCHYFDLRANGGMDKERPAAERCENASLIFTATYTVNELKYAAATAPDAVRLCSFTNLFRFGYFESTAFIRNCSVPDCCANMQQMLAFTRSYRSV